jgi:hypothetical protein
MRRAYSISLLALGLGGLGMLVAYGNVWIEITSPVLGGTATTAETVGVHVTPVTGSALSPAGGVMGLLTLVLGGVVILTRGLLRRAVGVLAVAAGLFGAVTAVAFTASSRLPDWLVDEVGVVLGEQRTLWWVMALAAGVLTAAGGGLVAVRGGDFATFSSRYERAGARPRSTWEALDHGIDPTADASDDDAARGDAPGARGTDTTRDRQP